MSAVQTSLARIAMLAGLAPALLGAQQVRLVASSGDEVFDLSAETTPVRIPAAVHPLVRSLRWRTARQGLQVATLDLRAGSLATAVQAIVVRMEPSRFRFSLQLRTQANGMTGTWMVDSAGAGVALAMNAGQFKETGPWGWLVLDGEEHRNPGRAPLAIGVRIDTAGRIHWVPPGREALARHDPTTAFAFQSFPLLFHDRRVPPILRDGRATNLAHRDARLVMGETGDGTLLFVLTRFAGLGTVAERVPIGLTTPEAIALMAALGARHAVMLDGGGSAQLLLRDDDGAETWWRALRTVPLGLVAEPRREH